MGMLSCVTSNYCTFGGFTCSHDVASQKTSFTLTQSYNLRDKLLVTEDAVAISNIDVATFVLDIDYSKKRAVAALPLSASTASTVTTCSSGFANIDNSCSTCPPGYGYSLGTCTRCERGFYSAGNSINTCTTCPNSFTTLIKGSTEEADCLDPDVVCDVGVATNALALVPPSGSKIKETQSVTIICNSGYAVAETATIDFNCRQPIPTCYSEFCLLS